MYTCCYISHITVTGMRLGATPLAKGLGKASDAILTDMAIAAMHGRKAAACLGKVKRATNIALKARKSICMAADA